MLKYFCTLLLVLVCLGTVTLPARANENEINKALESLVDMDPAMRAQGAVMLGIYASAADERVVPKLLESLEAEPDSKVKTAIIEALGEMAKVSDNPERVLRPLVSYLDSEDMSLALSAAVVLEKFSKNKLVQETSEKRLRLYQKGLASEDTRRDAAEGLANSTSPESLKILEKATQDPEAREMAIRALVAQEQEAALPIVVDFAQRALLAEEEDLRKLGLLAASSLDSPEKLKPLEEPLAKVAAGNDVTSLYAAELLYKIDPSPEKLEPFRRALASEESSTVASALSSLRNLREEHQKLLQPEVIAVLNKTDDPDVIRTVISVSRSGSIGNPAYLPAIVKKADHESAAVRLTIARAIPEYGQKSVEGLSALEKLLKDKETDIQVTALDSVYKMTGDLSKVEKTLKTLASDDKAFEVLVSNIYFSGHSALSQAVREVLIQKAKAGKDAFLPHLARQNAELTEEELVLFLENYDKLDDSTRSLVISRFYQLHAARPGVMEFLNKAMMDSKSDSKWTAASIYLSFTGDGEKVRPFISSGLKSGEALEISQALSALMQQSDLIGEYQNELTAVIHSDAEDYVRSTAFTVLSYDDNLAAYTAEQAIKLIRAGDIKLADTSGEKVLAEIRKNLTSSDKTILSEKLVKLNANRTALFETMSEIHIILKLMDGESGWPASVQAVLEDIRKTSPDETARRLASEVIRKMEGNS